MCKICQFVDIWNWTLVVCSRVSVKQVAESILEYARHFLCHLISTFIEFHFEKFYEFLEIKFIIRTCWWNLRNRDACLGNRFCACS